MSLWKRMGIYCIVAFAPVAAVHGARIGSIGGVQGPGLGSANISNTIWTFGEGSDDATASTIANFWSYSVTFTSVAPVDILINVINPGSLGTSEYAFDALYHTNNTGTMWTGFKIQLGFGSFDPGDFSIDNFVQSSDTDRLDFDRVELNDNAPGRTPVPIHFGMSLPEAGHTNNALTWTDVLVGSPGNASGTYHVDIPDSANIPGALGGDYQFTLRLTPLAAVAAPEPGACGMFALGLWVWSASRRHVHRG